MLNVHTDCLLSVNISCDIVCQFVYGFIYCLLSVSMPLDIVYAFLFKTFLDQYTYALRHCLIKVVICGNYINLNKIIKNNISP